jgi:drug/metabolite transporter (DMT)-like permease
MFKGKQSHIYAFLAVLLWASAYPSTKIALRYLPPLPLSIVRYVIAAAVIILAAR